MLPGRFQQAIDNNRKGRIVIVGEFLFKNGDFVNQVLSKILIMKADNNFVNNSITYWGYSEHFDKVARFDEAPLYNVIIHAVNGHLDTFQFKRAE